MIVISFGTPRSGTTYMESMFVHNPYTKSLGQVSNMMPYIFKETQKYDTFLFPQIERVANLFGDVCFKLQEASCCHPMNSQTRFIWMCDHLPKPIKLIRTYRNAFNVYRSMMFMKGKVRVEARFNPTSFDGIMAMILAEYVGYLSIKDRYDIASIDFDKLSDIDYLEQKLLTLNLHDDIIESCLRFHNKMYGKIPVRSGILSDGNIRLDLTKKQLETLEKVDYMRSIIT